MASLDSFPDATKTCADCARPFLLTAGERRFFADKGMTEPKRCRDCRTMRKAEQAARQDRGTPSMGVSPVTTTWPGGTR